MRKIESSISIQSKPDNIISAFTDFEMLHGWWGVERTLVQKKVGGLYTLAWGISDKGFGFVMNGIIDEYQLDKGLVIKNLVYLNPEKPFLGPMTLTIKAAKKEKLTEAYLCQDGYQSGKDWDWYYEAVKSAWPDVMQTLKDYLENKI